MRTWVPESSRSMQNLQHIVGGLSTIFIMITGVSFGKNDYFIAAFAGVIALIITRASSEISYQVNVRIIRENKR